MLTSGCSRSRGSQVQDAGVLGVALDLGRQPDPVAVGLHGALAGFEGVGLRRLAIAGGGAGQHAPVVEDPRHVDDGACPLGHLQHQVPVLGALELGVEAAHLFDQGAAQDAEVAGVHLRAHPLRRPVGLEEGGGVAPGGVDLVLVGVDVVGLGVGVDRRGDAGERVGVQGVVVVEQGDELAPGHRQGVVGGGDDAGVLGPVVDPDTRASAAARPVEDLAHVRLRRSRRRPGTAPSRSQLWRRTERSILRSTLGRRLVDRREDREAGRRHERLAQAAEQAQQHPRIDELAEDRDLAFDPRFSAPSIRLRAIFHARPACPSRRRVRRPRRSAGRAAAGSPRCGGPSSSISSGGRAACRSGSRARPAGPALTAASRAARSTSRRSRATRSGRSGATVSSSGSLAPRVEGCPRSDVGDVALDVAQEAFAGERRRPDLGRLHVEVGRPRRSRREWSRAGAGRWRRRGWRSPPRPRWPGCARAPRCRRSGRSAAAAARSASRPGSARATDSWTWEIAYSETSMP